MKTALWAIVAVFGTAAMGQAGGIDRSGQPLDILFKDGNYAELSYGWSNPDVSGDDLAQDGPLGRLQAPGASYDSVADDFHSPAFGLKIDLTEKLSFAVIGAEDYGANIRYPDEDGSLLGGTEAIADTYSLSVIGRYKVTERFSVHAGLRADRADGRISLDGLAYGGATLAVGGTINTADEVRVLTRGQLNGNTVSGYDVKLGSSTGYGYLIGGAYEIPEIALRVAVTYFSPIEHDFDTTETFSVDYNGNRQVDDTQTFESKTKVKTPEAINIDLQTGIAPDTLLFASFRWTNWSQFEIAPSEFEQTTGVGLVKVDDARTYEIGVARQVTDKLAASLAYSYDDVDGDNLVSPLAPTKGYQALAAGASYRVTERFEIAGGVKFFWLGDAQAETGTPDVARADFSDNTALTVGLRVGYYF